MAERVLLVRGIAKLCVCLLTLTWYSCIHVEGELIKSFGVQYEEGVQAYLEERWDDCIHSFESAVLDYRNLKAVTVNCRIKCENEADSSPLLFPDNIENLHHYERMVKKTLCLLKCKKVFFKEKQPVVSKKMEKNFEQLKAYEYLQLCYYQKKRVQDAASAVFTFLVVNPEHEVMLSNLKFYTTLPEVNVDEITNFEAQPYVALYVRGSEAYKNENYEAVINYVEESLEEYIRAEEGCRAYCEGPFDQGWFPDYTSSIANHFTYCLKCKRKCPLQLNTLNGERHEDLLPSHYHYLQFAYFKVGNLQKACEAVASYLLFFPVDETMKENLEYYKKMPQVKQEFFTPREEALKYVKRQEYETELMNFIEQEFIFQEDKPISGNELGETELSTKQPKILATEHSSSIISANEIIGDIIQSAFRHQENAQGVANVAAVGKIPQNKSYQNTDTMHQNTRRDKAEGSGSRTSEDNAIPQHKNLAHQFLKLISELGKSLTDQNQGFAGSKSHRKTKVGINKSEERELKRKAILRLIHKSSINNVTLIKEEDELKGPNRFLADGFAREDECDAMIQLAKIAAVSGDGYGGRKSPHTDLEKFEGMTIGKAALMAYYKLMDPGILNLFLDISDRGFHYVTRYFNLKKKLYFNYTHLVCRTAIINNNETSSSAEPHLSHQIHGDNCFPNDEKVCQRQSPAYFWRDYSSIIYLNNNFQGGEFFFAANYNQSSMQTMIGSKCGRMVGFSSGPENLHGVRGVIRGTRCAIGLWFTHDKAYDEVERILAKHVQKLMKENRIVSDQILTQLKTRSKFMNTF